MSKLTLTEEEPRIKLKKKFVWLWDETPEWSLVYVSLAEARKRAFLAKLFRKNQVPIAPIRSQGSRNEMRGWSADTEIKNKSCSELWVNEENRAYGFKTRIRAKQDLQEKNCPRRKETRGIFSEPHCPKVKLLHSKKERSVTKPRQGFLRWQNSSFSHKSNGEVTGLVLSFAISGCYWAHLEDCKIL